MGHNNYEIAFEFTIIETIISFDSYKYLCKNKSFLTNFEKSQWDPKYFVIAFKFTILITVKIFFGFKAGYLEESRISDILSQYFSTSTVLWGACNYNHEVHTVTDPYSKIFVSTAAPQTLKRTGRVCQNYSLLQINLLYKLKIF